MLTLTCAEFFFHPLAALAFLFVSFFLGAKMSATRFPTAAIYHKYAGTYIWGNLAYLLYTYVGHVNPGRAKRSVPFVYAAVMARLIQH